MKRSAKSSIRDQLLFCNHGPLFDDFNILAHRTKKFLLEIKENLLIKRDKLILNKNISSCPMFLFDKVQYDWIISISIDRILLFFCHGIFTLISVYFFVDLRKNWLLENGCSCIRNVAENLKKWICRNYLIFGFTWIMKFCNGFYFIL